jgi:hypothetical protein
MVHVPPPTRISDRFASDDASTMPKEHLLSDSAYSHTNWLASQAANFHLIDGEDDALVAIRQETKEHYGVDDITDDAPVFYWMRPHVKGLGDAMYEIPAHVIRRYLPPVEFPQMPRAVMPSETTETRRQELMGMSAIAEGTPEGLREILNRTRLYHELPTSMFPMEDGELRWFANGLFVMGPGDDPMMFQTPMSRVEEMVVARQAPTLPWIKSPPAVN